MSKFTKFMILFAGLSLAACTDAGRFDDTAPDSAMGANAAAGAGIIEGSANDPKSPLYFAQSIGDRVHFNVDQHTLDAEAKTTLDGQASWLATNAEYNAVIEGHADEQGTREYNLALGARRANAVREYLMSKGLPGSRMKTVSYGKEKPLAICSDESCYRQNRRAVTVLQAGLNS